MGHQDGRPVMRIVEVRSGEESGRQFLGALHGPIAR